MMDDGGDFGPRFDPTAIGQEIGREIKEAIEPLIDRLERAVQEVQHPAAQSQNANVARYAESTGQSESQASGSLDGIRSSVILQDISSKMDGVIAAVESVGVSIASNGGGHS